MGAGASLCFRVLVLSGAQRHPSYHHLKLRNAALLQWYPTKGEAQALWGKAPGAPVEEILLVMGLLVRPAAVLPRALWNRRVTESSDGCDLAFKMCAMFKRNLL